jgi:hypothetical protein
VAVKIPLGNIVLVRQVPDKQGGNPKDRFVVLVRDYNDGDAQILGVAITGSFSLPLPSTAVKMTSRKDGNCRTRLNKPCIADCTWLVVATPGDIIKRQGFAPPIELAKILQEVQNQLPTAPPAPPAPQGSTGS